MVFSILTQETGSIIVRTVSLSSNVSVRLGFLSTKGILKDEMRNLVVAVMPVDIVILVMVVLLPNERLQLPYFRTSL